ncbi:MAG: hypothetical protein ACRC1H_06835, partial [Caldilineaceae bacterium]
MSVAGTFSTGGSAALPAPSDELLIDASRTSLLLTLQGLDGSNTVKTQKRSTANGPWVDQVTYSSNQTALSVPVVEGERWRVCPVTQQAVRDVRYVLELGAVQNVAGGFVPPSPSPGTTLPQHLTQPASALEIPSRAWLDALAAQGKLSLSTTYLDPATGQRYVATSAGA